jgi:hypothetical protein
MLAKIERDPSRVLEVARIVRLEEGSHLPGVVATGKRDVERHTVRLPTRGVARRDAILLRAHRPRLAIRPAAG